MSIPRDLTATLATHFAGHRKTAFVTRPRPVGNTTAFRAIDTSATYLNSDDEDARRTIPCIVPARTLLSQLP